MSRAKLTFQSALWNHAGKILEYLLMYGTSIVIARGLGVAENGRFVGLFSLSQMLLVFCSFGLETSLNKFLPQLQQEKAAERTTFILRKALLIRVVAFFGAAAAFYAAIHAITIPLLDNAGTVLLIVLAFTGIRSMFPLFAMVLTAQLHTALTARVNLIVRGIEIVAVIVLAQVEFSVKNLFLLFCCTSALHVVVYATLSRLNFFGRAEPVEMHPIIAFGGIYWINTIVDFILGRQGDVLFLTNLLPDASEAGLYDVAFSVAQLASMAMTVGLTGVTFATFARLAVTDSGTMDRFYTFSIRVISLLTIPVFAFMIVHAPAVITSVYSSQYGAAAALVQGILLFRIFARLFGGPENAEYLLSHGRVGLVAAFGVAAAVTNIGLNILLIPRLGAMGSVLASGSANLLVNVLAACAVYATSANRMQVIFWVKTTSACSLAAILSIYLVPGDHAGSLLGSGVLYVILVGACFLIIKPLTRDDTEWLAQIHGKSRKWLDYFTALKPRLAESNPS